MRISLDEVCVRHQNEQITMVFDGAGWHTSGLLTIPQNMRLVSLPPCAPELNPTKHIWDDLREKAFHNRVFESVDRLEHHLAESLRELEQDNERIRSIVAWAWIVMAPIK